MARISLAFCTDGIYPLAVGGIQKHSKLLIEELSRYEEIDITVIHPHSKALFSDLPVREVAVKGINPAKNYLLECYNYSSRVFKVLNTIQPDVVYSQGLSVWFKAWKYSDRLVLHPHGLEPFQAISLKEQIVLAPLKFVFKRLFRKARYVISLGGHLSDILVRNKVHNSKIIEIPNAVAIQSLTPRFDNGNKVKALFFGRFASNKGINVLFSAIDELEKAGLLQHFEFTIAGTGPLFETYNSANRFENVKLTGFIADGDISRLYKSNNLFVLPTLFEGMPTVVLEAMSYGLPIIVSDVGATKVIVDNSNGRLITPNSVESLVQALTWYMELSVPERSKLGSMSIHKINASLNWPKVGDSFLSLFKSIKKV